MKSIFSNFLKVSISTSIIFMIFGLLLFFNPEDLIVIISELAGFFLILVGVIQIVYYFKDQISFHYNLAIGLFLTTIGIILISNTNIIAIIIPVLIGSSMLALGIKKIDLAMSIKATKENYWISILIMGFLTLVCGILLIINPIKGAFLATKAVGLVIVLYSVINIIDTIILKHNLKKINKIIDIDV